MSDYPVQGKLRIRPDSFERDLEFIKEHVGEVSNARLVSFPGFDFIKFWWVDFAATQAQWAALEPQLSSHNIFATMYESPALADDDSAPTPQRSTYKSPYRWVPYASLAALAAALALAFVLRDWAPVFCGVALLALGVALVSGAIVALMEY